MQNFCLIRPMATINQQVISAEQVDPSSLMFHSSSHELKFITNRQVKKKSMFGQELIIHSEKTLPSAQVLYVYSRCPSDKKGKNRRQLNEVCRAHASVRDLGRFPFVPPDRCMSPVRCQVSRDFPLHHFSATIQWSKCEKMTKRPW